MDNSQKIPLQVSLGKLAKRGADEAISLLAKSLPASIVKMNGSIATVKFELLSDYNLPQIDVPVLESAYIRQPLQPGDMGILIPCDASLAAVSGMGQNTADLSTPPNLSAMLFVPISNKKWAAVDDKMLVLTGISDVMLRDTSHQLQLENEYASWNSLIQQLNTLLTTIGPLLTTPTVLTPFVAATLNPVKARA